jgi:hypothetical protein
MYSAISEDMMEMFSSAVEYSNLIASPLSMYKKDNKELTYYKKLFFEKVNNVPDFENYLNLFKWIDSSIGFIIRQIIPASSNYSEDVSTVLESHILERNKHIRRLPVFQEARKIVSFPIKGIAQLTYSWISGSAPVNNDTSKSALWLSERAERNNKYVTSNNSLVDADRQKILNSLNNIGKQTSYKLIANSNTYSYDDYFLTKGATPYKIDCVFLNGPVSKNQLQRDNNRNNLFLPYTVPKNSTK